MSDSFFNQTIEIQNPVAPLGMIRVAGGFVNALISLVMVLQIKGSVVLENIGSTDDTILLIRGIIAIFVLVYSIKNILTGFNSLRPLLAPPRCPEDYSDYTMLENSLLYKDMPSLKLVEGAALSLALKYVSNRALYLSRRPRAVMARSVLFIRNYFIWMVIIIIVYTVIKSTNIIEDFTPPTPWIMMLVLGFMSFVYILGINLIIPKAVPKCEVSEQLVQIRGGGDPNNLPNNLEFAAMQFRRDKIPNRVYNKSMQASAGQMVTDTGLFRHSLIIENQPLQSEHNSDDAGRLFALGASVFSMVGLIMSVALKYDTSTESGLAQAILNILGGVLVIICAEGMYRKGESLCNVFRYQSVLMFLDVNGTFSSAQLTAGKAINDSFESRNTVIRSDSDIKLYTTKVLSEAYGLTGKREIVGMVIDNESSSGEEMVMQMISEFKNKGVAIVGMDFNRSEAKNIVEANAATHAMKEQITAEKTKSLPPADTRPALSLDQQSLQADSASPAVSVSANESPTAPGLNPEPIDYSSIPLSYVPVDVPEHQLPVSSEPVQVNQPSLPNPSQAIPPIGQPVKPDILIDPAFNITPGIAPNPPSQVTGIDGNGINPHSHNAPSLLTPDNQPSSPAPTSDITSNPESSPLNVSGPLFRPSQSIFNNTITPQAAIQTGAGNMSQHVQAGQVPPPPAPLSSVIPQSVGGDSDTKVCPECAETVKAAARICRFCRHEFYPPPKS